MSNNISEKQKLIAEIKNLQNSKGRYTRLDTVDDYDICGVRGGDNTTCFDHRNSLQEGYFGPIQYSSDEVTFAEPDWRPLLIDNNFNIFWDYGVLDDLTFGTTCHFPPAGGYDTVILNDGSLHVQSSMCHLGLYGPGNPAGISVYSTEGERTLLVDIEELKDDAQSDTFPMATTINIIHHSMWPLHNGNFIFLGDSDLSLQQYESLGGDIQGESWNGSFKSGFFIEVTYDTPGAPGADCNDIGEGAQYWSCTGRIAYEWYLADHFVQDYKSNNPHCSDYEYKEEPSGCYAPTNELYKYPHMININLHGETANVMDTSDWAHLNTIHYTPSEDDGGFCPVTEPDGCYGLSSRTIGDGEQYIIGKTTGDIIYRCCNPENYGRGVDVSNNSYEQISRHQHGMNWIPPGYPGEGNLIFFNNSHYMKYCTDIDNEDECNECVGGNKFGTGNNGSCYWNNGGCHVDREAVRHVSDYYEMVQNYDVDITNTLPWLIPPRDLGWCAYSGVVEIKPNYNIIQDSYDPFQFDEIYIMDSIYGSAPVNQGYNLSGQQIPPETINMNDYSNRFHAAAEGGVFKLPNGNLIVSHMSSDYKYEVADPYGVPQMMALFTEGMARTGDYFNITHARSFKLIPTCTDPTANNYDPASVYMYHIDDGSCNYGPVDLGCGEGNPEPVVHCYDDSDGDGFYDPLAPCGESCLDEHCPNNCISILDGQSGYTGFPPDDDPNTPFDGLGCTDTSACNYNPDALVDNGSCLYPGDMYDDISIFDYNDDLDTTPDFFNTCSKCDYQTGFADWDSADSLYEAIFGLVDKDLCCNVQYAVELPNSRLYAGELLPLSSTCTTGIDATDEYQGYPCHVGFECDDGILVCHESDCEDWEEDIFGCTDTSACNYDVAANVDDDSCQYAEDNYDCDGNCTAGLDCNDDCGGSAIVDDCGVCDGDNSSCTEIEDCLGIIGGTAIHDVCGYCENHSHFNFFISYTCEILSGLDPTYIYPCSSIGVTDCCPLILAHPILGYPEFYPDYINLDDYALNGFLPPCGLYTEPQAPGICEECDSESSDCSSCELSTGYFGSACCDAAWYEWGTNCCTLEADYGWDCVGCECPGDAVYPCDGGESDCEGAMDMCGWCEESSLMGITTTACDSDQMNADKYWIFQCSSIGTTDCCAYVPGQPFYGYPEFYPDYINLDDYALNGFLPPCGIHTDDTELPGICEECL